MGATVPPKSFANPMDTGVLQSQSNVVSPVQKTPYIAPSPYVADTVKRLPQVVSPNNTPATPQLPKPPVKPVYNYDSSWLPSWLRGKDPTYQY